MNTTKCIHALIVSAFPIALIAAGCSSSDSTIPDTGLDGGSGNDTGSGTDTGNGGNDTGPKADTGGGNDTGSGNDTGTGNDTGASDAPVDANNATCAAMALRNDCVSCCASVNPAAFQAFDTLLTDCACNNPGACQTECANTLCASPQTATDATCNTCIQTALGNGGACQQQVIGGCIGDPTCKPFVQCAQPCAGKP